MRKDSFWTLALVAVFVIFPVWLISTQPVDAAVGSWPRLALLVLSLLIGVPGFILLAIAVAQGMILTGRRRRTIQEVERQTTLTAVGMGSVAVTCTLALAADVPAAAGFYGALALAYALWCMPMSVRRVYYRLVIVVRATPEEAFALVSNPRNWSRYLPQIGVEEPIDEPLHLGSVVRTTWLEKHTAYTEDEQVIDFETGRRFGTASVHRRPSDGIYELTPVGGGTEIAWSYRSALTYPQAVLGGALRRRALVAHMVQRRKASLQVIKGLLEEQVPVPV
jgi:Polyketide cyclase / dehydrase and lipid transport